MKGGRDSSLEGSRVEAGINANGHHAGNSAMSDGAAAAVVMSAERAQIWVQPLARFVVCYGGVSA